MNSVKNYFTNDLKQIELMTINKLITTLDCSLIYPPCKYIYLNNGLKYKLLYSTNDIISIPSKDEPNFYILVEPKYKNCLTFICANFNFYLIKYETVEDFIINKMYIKYFLHCVNSVVAFNKDLLISKSVKL